MEKLAIGIDIGGTSLKAALIGRDGGAANADRVVTPKTGSALLDAVLGMIARQIQAAGGAEKCAGVGIGTPGFVDPEGVIFGHSVNLPGWEGTSLRATIQDRFGLHAVTVNDASAATLAEARFGAGRGVHHLVCLVLGTGIGGGIVADGRLYLGARGMAGEFGHVSVDPEGEPCGCGQRGCVERYASAPGIVRLAREMAGARGIEETAFARMVRSSGDALTSRQIYDFVAAGDPVALRLNDLVCEKIARAICITINTLAPELVVLGGGVMAAGAVIVDTVKRFLPRFALPEPLAACRIALAELGEDAGVVGAGALALDRDIAVAHRESDR